MDIRSQEQIREHYEVEREIADRLRNSTAEQRRTLYTAAYDELFARLPHHPLLTSGSEKEKQRQLTKHLLNLDGMIDKDSTFVEIGPGDCSLSLEVAKLAGNVFAVDVSKEVTKRANAPENFELIISDGSSIPVPPESVDIVYSDQLMEHLHPDDALQQLKNIFQVLKPGGMYFCITPNRMSGPHDVSRTFDTVATGLHLHEYTVTELDKIFKEAGFSRTKILFRFSHVTMHLPVFPYKVIESLLGGIPGSARKLLTFNRAVRFLLGVKLLATK
ncbi:hypothetical protein BH10ACI3_BH10ACI3_04480 [soil metagenome]